MRLVRFFVVAMIAAALAGCAGTPAPEITAPPAAAPPAADLDSIMDTVTVSERRF
jgi:hypothetical protein